MRIMIRIISPLFAVLALIGPASFAGAQPTLHFSAGIGDGHSAYYDLYAQQTFKPLETWETCELVPLANIGLTAWHDNDGNETVFGLIGALGLKLSFYGDTYRPFILLSGGPSFISSDEFVGRDLGSKFIFNTHARLGLDFGAEFKHHFDVHATHYSNAHTSRDNDGYNALGLAYGYSF